MLRQGRRAYYFKIAYDERVAKLSPGVQLTLDLTQRLCADASIDDVDSIAVARHPMIDHVWRDRLAVADLLVPTHSGALPGLVLAGAISGRRAARALRAPLRPPHPNPTKETVMSTALAMIDAGAGASFDTDFPLKPFAIRHRLAGHALFELPRIIDLLRTLPRDQIEFNSGKVEIGQDPDKMPLFEMEPVEVIRRIQTASAWMVLKRVESEPAYRKVLEDALLAVAMHNGHSSLRDAGFYDIRGFMFVSSPNSTTPFHIDGEDNVFVQIHGSSVPHHRTDQSADAQQRR